MKAIRSYNLSPSSVAFLLVHAQPLLAAVRYEAEYFWGFPEGRAFGLVHRTWSPSEMVRSPTPFQPVLSRPSRIQQSTHDPSTLADLTNPRRWPMVSRCPAENPCPGEDDLLTKREFPEGLQSYVYRPPFVDRCSSRDLLNTIELTFSLTLVLAC